MVSSLPVQDFAQSGTLRKAGLTVGIYRVRGADE